ncbi:NADP-dependent oxidoreductase [Chryseobacterium populi]|uniref:Zn-dependent oxidoreductase, NADPH:quinone reductase n=1 Tax=Chryseobacterium populi TaxID=1144316 RepID=J2TCC9_9FLAO|nr:NADP-dependent oxidoreductase [Chryseobacterium populi]EJL75862.1 Zn-dependent oxidoreductase, NADPH:quinone reductase [Chryseobacterium populi]
MKAITLKSPGGVENLEYTEIGKPDLREGEVLIRVKAIGINPIDVKTRSGKGAYEKLKDQSPLILGWDVAGIVEESQSPLFNTGDEVFGMINFPGHGKAYAEYVAAPADQLALKPSNLSFETAAASALVTLTAWQALVDHANVQKGQNILIHAAAGGVGHIAVQIAKYLGATVTGTSSLKNREFVLSLGADQHINYHGFDWDAAPRNFDFVLDTIGGDNIDKSLKVTKENGTIISIPSGMNEKVTEKAAAEGVKGYPTKVHSDGEDMKQIASLLEKGIIKPYISHVFPFDKMKEAHLEQETGRTVGKIIINL